VQFSEHFYLLSSIFYDLIKNKCENYQTMIEKCKNLQGNTNLVWSHAKIIFNSLYQSAYARDVSTCEIWASQVSRNHEKLSLSVLLDVSKEVLTKKKK
jgi:hypothetical protein